MISLPKNIKFVLTDFDGVITDHCVYIDSKGEMTVESSKTTGAIFIASGRVPNIDMTFNFFIINPLKKVTTVSD